MPRKPDLSIIGKTYNNLIVNKLTDDYNAYNRRLYECTCLICGKKRLATKQNLQRGEIKDCGKHWSYNDIKNKKFGKLTAMYVVEESTENKNRCKVWHCKCDCGKEVDVYYNYLKNGRVISCGCVKKDNLKKTYVDGTAPCKIKHPDKLRKTNTSGVTGVWYDKNKQLWCAEIVFKHKKYFLGRFKEKKDAIAARKVAEKNIFGEFLKWYEENKGENGMTREKEVELLMKDGDTRSEAEKHLKDGAMIIEDLAENLESYLDEWDIDEEDREAYRNMVENKIPVAGWGIVEDGGKTFYIMYVL